MGGIINNKGVVIRVMGMFADDHRLINTDAMR